MQITYGSYSFDANSTELTVAQEVEWNQGGQPLLVRSRYAVKGWLGQPSDGQSGIDAKIFGLQAALSRQFQDLTLKTDAGAATSHTLRNAGSLSGVRITSLSFPEFRGPEFASYRTFEFTAEATYPVANAALLLVAYTESLSFWGGAPLYVHKPAINGPPQKQMVYPLMPYGATQVGSAVGFLQYPNAPGPTWPFALKEAGKFGRKAPKREGNGYRDFETTWEYSFENAGPLAGLPNRWIN